MSLNVRIDNVSKRYGTRTVLDSVSFSMGDGEITALLGPNGSGKTTMIKMLANIHEQSEGTISINDENIRDIDPVDLAKLVGYVPQQFLFTPYSTVFETVLLGRRQYIKWAVTEEELNRVQNSLDALEISHMAGNYMDKLSGGERQKVFIARALAQEPELFLLDEPTSALDIKYQIEVMETMRSITKEKNKSMIVAVHDLNLAYKYADKVVVLKEGKVAAYGNPHEVLTPECIKSVYGVDSFIVENEHGRFIMPFKGN